jgi:MFS family permease
MLKVNAETNVRLYVWYVLFSEPLLWGPVLIISLMTLAQMSFKEIVIMEAVVVLGFFFLESQSGAIADHWGRKRVVIAGRVFRVISTILFASMNCAVDAWIANIIWMIGQSLSSGADESLMYESLQKQGYTGVLLDNENRRIQGLAESRKLFAVAVLSLVAGYLAEIHMRLPLLLSIPGVIVGLCITFYFTETVENGNEKRRFSVRELHTVCVQKITEGWKYCIEPSVALTIVFITLFAVVSKLWFFSYNPYFAYVDLELRYYGYLFAVLNIVAWYFSKNAHSIITRYGERCTFMCMVLTLAFPLLVMSILVTKASCSMILMQNFVRGMSSPFFSTVLNRNIPNEVRATVSSMQSTARSVTECISNFGYAALVGVVAIPYALGVLGAIVFIVGMFGYLFYRKHLH